jgi:hypothetical protein
VALLGYTIIAAYLAVWLSTVFAGKASGRASPDRFG